jgi:hypothetical protein
VITYKEYWAQVKAIVEDLHAEVKAERVTDSDEAREWLFQAVDGHEWVIYTSQSLSMLQHSKHDEDAFEDGSLTFENTGELYMRLAYHALLGDVMDEAGDLEALFEFVEEKV